jgi:NAD+ kinase
MFRKIGMIVNQEKKDALKDARLVLEWLEGKKIQVFLSPWLGESIDRTDLIVEREKMGRSSELVISLGGDGTLLRAARDFASYHTPLLGINLGELGFLTEIPILRYKEGLTRILEGGYKEERRLMLKIAVHRARKKAASFVALNDVVISKAGIPRIINLRTFVSNEFITTYSADGLVISTPTGSTAYSLSSGGPVVHPNLGVIILSPICAHTLAVRPLIVSRREKIKVILERGPEKVLLTMDGQVDFDLEDGDVIRAEEASYQAILIRMRGKFFFKTLRTKLGWTGTGGKSR